MKYHIGLKAPLVEFVRKSKLRKHTKVSTKFNGTGIKLGNIKSQEGRGVFSLDELFCLHTITPMANMSSDLYQ